MAIRTYLESEKTFFEVYVNGFDNRGIRIQRKRRGIETRKKAESVEFELMRELAQRREEKVPYRWGEWRVVCLNQMKLTKKPSTIINYDRLNVWVNPHWDQIEIHKISKSDVHEMIFEKCKEIVTPNSRRTILKLTRRIFEMAVEEGILDRNPCNGISVQVPDVEGKVLTNAEVEIFLHEAKVTNHRFYFAWVMALLTGCRSGELYALKWTDIDLQGRTISISKAWSSKNGIGPTKTQRSRVVPISNDLLDFLKELRIKSTDSSDFVLPRLIEWTSGEQARVTREFCAAVGITEVKFHDLRATFITNLLARGEALARVMAIVGHSQLKTTNGYLRKAGVDVLGGTDKLGYGLPKSNGPNVISFLPYASRGIR